MSTEELRRELERIGGAAPIADVPNDTWSRARRARRRDRLAAVTVAFVALAMAAGLAAWMPGRGEVDPANGRGVGVPDTIHSVPHGSLEPTADLAGGRSAAVLMSDDELPVVIDAADGTYTALDLPGFGPLQRDQGAVTLSPDGKHLAWGWSSSEPGGITRTGVRILDLVTGEQRSIPSREPIFVYAFTWSPDNRWLVWDGAEGNWSGSGFGAGPETAGRIGPGADVMTSVPRTSAESTALAVDNDGTVLIATSRRQTLWNGEVLGSGSRARGWWYPVLLTPRDGVLLEGIVRSDDPDSYRITYRKPTPSGPVPAPAITAVQYFPLGWIGPSSVALVKDRGEESFDLALINLGDEVTVRRVGVVPPRHVSVAVDLMTDARPTVDRPDPSWLDPDDGWSGARVALGLGLGVVGLAILGAAARLLRRRRM